MGNKRNIRKPKRSRTNKRTVTGVPPVSGAKQQKSKTKKPEQDTPLTQEEKLELVNWVDDAKGEEENAVMGMILKTMPTLAVNDDLKFSSTKLT